MPRRMRCLCIACLLIAALPVALFASSENDRKIEEAARASYNYRTVLSDHVKVAADDGVVTLTGTVQDSAGAVVPNAKYSCSELR